MTITVPRTVDGYHVDIKEWKSNMALASDEIKFIENLIHSYIFEPRTPNLFERLEGYKLEIKSLKVLLDNLLTLSVKHDAELSGMSECDTLSCDAFFIEKHLRLRAQYEDFMETYIAIKREIFEYCGTVLKSNKMKSPS